MAEKRCFKVANLAPNADNLEIGHLDDYRRPNFNLYHSLYENGTVKRDCDNRLALPCYVRIVLNAGSA